MVGSILELSRGSISVSTRCNTFAGADVALGRELEAAGEGRGREELKAQLRHGEADVARRIAGLHVALADAEERLEDTHRQAEQRNSQLSGRDREAAALKSESLATGAEDTAMPREIGTLKTAVENLKRRSEARDTEMTALTTANPKVSARNECDGSGGRAIGRRCSGYTRERVTKANWPRRSGRFGESAESQASSILISFRERIGRASGS
jgi:hypothetical protein